MFAVGKALLILIGSGLAAGSSVGWSAGSIFILLPLTILFKQLLEVEHSPSRAAQSLAVFVACLYGAGQWGAAIAVAPDLRPWTLLIWLLVGASHAAVAGLTGYFAYRLPLSAQTKMFGLIPVLWVLRERVLRSAKQVSRGLLLATCRLPAASLPGCSRSVAYTSRVGPRCFWVPRLRWHGTNSTRGNE